MDRLALTNIMPTRSTRDILRSFKILRYLYQLLMLVKRLLKSVIKKFRIFFLQRKEHSLLGELKQKLRALYPTNLNIKNTGEFPYYYFGRNFLGYPGMSFLEKDGENVGMSEGELKSGEQSLSIIQLKTDLEINFKNLFKKFQPRWVVDFGTNAGGSAVYFYGLMREYTDPKELTIDITDEPFNQYLNFHKAFKTQEKIQTILNKSTLETKAEVEKFLANRQPGERALFSFDDLHTYEHTFAELELYAPLLKSGDVILMQDTWNQGLIGHETSPMLSVFRFLKENPDWSLDEDFCKTMVLPCNFIYGVMVKK